MTAAPMYERLEQSENDIIAAAQGLAWAINVRTAQLAGEEYESGPEPAPLNGPGDLEECVDFLRYWADALDLTIQRMTAAEVAQILRELRVMRDQADIR